jgi:hypothetical protein
MKLSMKESRRCSGLSFETALGGELGERCGHDGGLGTRDADQ